MRPRAARQPVPCTERAARGRFLDSAVGTNDWLASRAARMAAQRREDNNIAARHEDVHNIHSARTERDQNTNGRGQHHHCQSKDDGGESFELRSRGHGFWKVMFVELANE